MKGTLIIGAVLFGIIFLRGCVFYDRCEHARSKAAENLELTNKARDEGKIGVARVFMDDYYKWSSKETEACRGR